MKKEKRQHKINDEIKYQQVRLTEGGIMSISEALKIAEAKEMDVVMLNESAQPPVCKIMSYEKYLYELSKKPKQKTLETKEIKLGPNTAQNDLDYRIKHIIEFLDDGHKVKLSMKFSGREMIYVDRGKELMLKVIVAVEEHGTAEAIPKLEGKNMFTTLKPKPKK